MNMNKQPDFIAQLKYKTKEEGGRESYAASGYFPQIKFSFSEKETSGKQAFIDKDRVYPGETVSANIELVSPHLFEKCLTEGMEFEFKEGQRVCGTGIVITIINGNLNKR